MSIKTEKDNVLISIDLCRDYSQVAYCKTNSMNEPESVSTVSGEEKFLIPTVIGRAAADYEVSETEENKDETEASADNFKVEKLDSGEETIATVITPENGEKTNEFKWLIGDEAKKAFENGKCELSSDIIKDILSEKKITIGNDEYSGYEVLQQYLLGLLTLVKDRYDLPKPDRIVVTVEYPDRLLVNLIRNVLENLGIEKENIKVLGHSESLIYYTIFQKKEIWANDVFVFDFTENQFMARRLNTVRARLPQPVVVEEMDFSDRFSIDALDTEEGRKELDKRFEELLRDYCGKFIVSTVFLTGVGFYKEWMEDSIRFLCSKRRVFQGYNLFVKGAGMAAMSDLGMGHSDEYQFVCSGRTLVNIEMETVKGDRQIPVVLSKAGINWYEAGARAEAILDDTNELIFNVNSSVSKNSKQITISLKSFPKRPNKTTRVEIILAYKNDSQCVVVVKDLGFGEMFKASGEIVRETINIEEFI